MEFRFLPRASSDVLWGAESGNPAVRLVPIAQPRMLWLNTRAARLDPAWHDMQESAAAYTRHLLAMCARLIPACADDEASRGAETGYADRYGGAGIGRNGGSGRAVVVGGYHVKGVGPTPLVSCHTAPEHASGGAYLEECIREVIHSEVVSAEFPYGAVPVLAVIDTGLVQVWETGGAPKHERRCLLVRPAFVRPAHFERATGFLDLDTWTGSRDVHRVRQAFTWLKATDAPDGPASTLVAFARRWATQLAYGFVHRLSHGGHSTSNICLDGALVDFGASTALPSWAKTRIIPGGQVFGHEFAALAQALTPAMYYWARFGDAGIAAPEFQQNVLNLAAQEYNRTIMIEVLRLLGLTRRRALGILESPVYQQVAREIGVVIRHFQQDRLDILESTPVPARAWDLDLFWSDNPPPHLQGLRRLLADDAGHGLPADDIVTASRRCRLLQSTRHILFREESKSALFAELEGAPASPPTLDSITRLVNLWVARARRDSMHEFDDAVPAGFAVSSQGSYALFTRLADGSLFAVDEHRASFASACVERLPVTVGAPAEVCIGNAAEPIAAVIIDSL